MEKKHFSIKINASRQKVWDILWGETTYPQWTAAFTEGSAIETDWKEGSKVLFLDGKGMGMVSKIETSRPPEFLSFKHLGIVKDGVEDLTSKEVLEWSGAEENYTLKEINGHTEVVVDLGLAEVDMEFLADVWPKALEKLKGLAEG